MSTEAATYRQFAPGMGQAVAERTILRKILKDGIELPSLLSVHPKDPDRGHIIRICQERGIGFALDPEQEIRFANYLEWENWATSPTAYRTATPFLTLVAQSTVQTNSSRCCTISAKLRS
ncbi:hypothetical protein CC53_gp076 [Rhizobium phage vB_RleS_L338C]|uniref:hypothetical protein n=1 Tax=Rhizobium phage vB_RleS_L338C TaxID=1414737 RepID=UPI0003D90D98|nr:hypothetical protein CC53_gp076 [Rhizobium phage vB_RleS_L338C]AHC30493.1 hypothetical protein L338C_076 [Rhizobium phage vB_RleS_L338C]